VHAPRSKLTHTSGAADYFDGKVSSGLRVSKQVVAEPERSWTPDDLLAVSRDRQRPVGRPGQRFHYSDTGYVLLGRVLEAVTGAAFHDLVHRRVVETLGLKRTFLPFRSSPALGLGDLAPMYLGRTEVSRFRGLTCDWAGGGIASTPDDLLLLGAALHDGRLITPESLAFLARPRHRFRPGLAYGAGMMTVRFEGFAPWLRGQPRLLGHIGVTATHLFHDPVHGAEIALNFASTREMTRSFRALFEVVRLLGRVGS
jgi:D-alanyl-D-alanine carboxypeptidase